MQLNQNGIAEFIAECEEIVQKVGAGLAAIEEGKISAELVAELYRGMHTLKGSALLYGFKDLGELAHTLETSLDPLRRGGGTVRPALMSVLYESTDLIEKIVASIKAGAQTSFQAEITRLIPMLIEHSVQSFGRDFEAVKDVVLYPEERVSLVNADVTPAVAAAAAAAAAPSASQPESVPTPNQAPPASGATVTANSGESGESNSTIRVSVGLLDKLMALTGEMVLIRNQVLQHAGKSDDLELMNLSQKLDLVTSELQGDVMKTRMQPIGNVLAKFHRVARDLSKDLGKKIEVSLAGSETELDKTLLEAIKDPLTHIVRNCCDHGLESPEERKKAGKSETGHIAIRAFHEGGQVIIEISDDGRGISKEKALKKALEKGIVSSERAATLTDREIYNLIFLPGFSTAAQVTNVSGRGVGMDVVKNNIEKIGGQVELISRPGLGMTVKLKIPLTLAIVPALIVRCGEGRYAIPQIKLVELVRVEGDSADNRLEFLQGRPVYRLRGNLLPLVSSREVLGLGSEAAIDGEPRATNIVVLTAEGQMFGLIVDEIQDTADIVVKPLQQFLKNLTIYSGATVLGDGSVALILDIIGLANHAKLHAEKREDETFLSNEKEAAISQDRQEYLFFKLHAKGTYAIPLDLVQRLEEFGANTVEYSGEQKVVRYRDSVLPLLSLDTWLKFENDDTSRERLPVIVVRKSGKAFGVVVEKILDVLAVDARIEEAARSCRGIMGNMIHNSEVVVVVDILDVLEMEFSASAPAASPLASEGIVTTRGAKAGRILYAEDNAFFRRHVGTVLQEAGYELIVAKDGLEALTMLEGPLAKNPVSLVLSDIEMPNLGGLDLARRIREIDNLQGLPLIAMSTKFSDASVREGKEAGFNSYLQKMDAHELLREIERLLGRKHE